MDLDQIARDALARLDMYGGKAAGPYGPEFAPVHAEDGELDAWAELVVSAWACISRRVDALQPVPVGADSAAKQDRAKCMAVYAACDKLRAMTTMEEASAAGLALGDALNLPDGHGDWWRLFSVHRDCGCAELAAVRRWWRLYSDKITMPDGREYYWRWR